MFSEWINDPGSSKQAYLKFSLNPDKTVGHVYNGDWDFKVVEFNPPYMKVIVLHPRKEFEVEYNYVRPA